jgi:carboxyl-terminal processing protease
VREGAGEPFDVSIIRDTIKLTAVRSPALWATGRAADHHLQRPDLSGAGGGLKKAVEELGGMDKVDGLRAGPAQQPGRSADQAIKRVGRLP